MSSDAAPTRSSIQSDGLLLPRGLIFVASLWLIVSWILSIGLRPPLQPSSASYTPAVRTMLFCVGLGMMVGWPLLRLSEPATRYPVRRTALDLVVLVALTQVVVWPLRLVTPWSTERTLLVDLTLAGWTALAGAVIATTSARSAAVRTGGMAICLLLCVLGPVIGAVGLLLGAGPYSHELVEAFERLGALTALQSVTAGGPGEVPPVEWRACLALLLAAVAAWTVTLALAALRRTGGPGASQPVS